MEKRKIMGIGLSALLFLSIAGSAVCAPETNSVFAAETDDTETAPLPDEGTGETNPSGPETPEGAVSLTLDNADLFLPASYEQYLPLNRPIDVAIGDRYIAVAQDNRIYICNRTGNEIAYTYYQHEQHISKIQFSDEDRLYFSDSLLNFYELEFTESGFHADMKGVNASTFYIANNTLFVAAVSDSGTTYTMSKLDSPSEYTQFNKTDFQVKPQMAYSDGKLYCIVNSLVTIYQGETLTQRLLYETISVTGLQSSCAFNGHLYYSINNELNSTLLPNGIYSCNLASFTSTPVVVGSGYGALTAHNGHLYSIHGNSVLEYEVTENSASLTGYEIASSSDSVNRLSGAQDTVRAGDLLVTADTENRRVSVYNFSTNQSSVIPCESAPSIVATDGKTIAVACGAKIYTCTYGSTGDAVLTLRREMQSNIKGLVCMYGNVYFVSNNAVYGCLGIEDTVSHDYGTPLRMTGDLYGNIYVSTDKGAVYSFTEDNFLKKNQGNKLGITLPENHTSLRADFEGNLYCLSGGTVYKNNAEFTLMEEFAKIDGSAFVYYPEAQTAEPVSFALGFENSEVYILFGNYFIKSKEEALEIPTLSKIAAGGIAEEVFSVHEHENILAEIPEKTVGITITLSDLADSEYFPYDHYGRIYKNSRGVLLGETEKYSLVLLFHEEQNSYTANLFQKSAVTLVEDTYYEETSGQYYLSSSVSSYYAPCLEKALAETTLTRGTFVTVLGYLSAPDYVYALVSYTAEDGETARNLKTGYVPATFLTAVAPLPGADEEFLPVYLKADKDGVTLVSKDGEELVITERTEAKAWKNGNGTYTVRVDKDGKSYYGTVDEKQIDWKNSDSLRIALIIILSVLALVILGAYIFLLPRKTQETKANSKKEKAEKSSAKKE